MRGRCTFEGCALELSGYGYCKSHRQQQRRGRPLTPLRPRPGSVSKGSRFWGKVARGPGCWEWNGNFRPQGYGIFTEGQKVKYAHRVAWELTHGPIPDGLVIDHLCFNRACVNPAHLRVVTQQINAQYTRRGTRKVPVSGSRGVYRNRDKWLARVKHDGVVYNLGSHVTKEAAERAVQAKRQELFVYPEFQEPTK